VTPYSLSSSITKVPQEQFLLEMNFREELRCDKFFSESINPITEYPELIGNIRWLGVIEVQVHVLRAVVIIQG
jgi:hypothetical protein